MSSPGFLATHYLAITIDGMEIDLSRAKDTTNNATHNEVAVLQPAPDEALVLDQTTVNGFYNGLGDLFPSTLRINVRDVSLAEYQKPKGKSGAKIIAANFAVDIDVSKLPLVGHMFPKDLTFSVENIQALFSKTAISDSTALSGRLPPDIPPFPEKITENANFAARLKVGDETITISSGEVSAVEASKTAQPNMATGGQHSQGNVNKKFGPVYIQSVDIKFVNGYLNFVITGSIKLGPLTVSLDQLEVGSKLSEFDLDYGLHGLSVDYKKNQVNIGGGLVHDVVNGLDVYNGALAVDLTKFQLSALGSYANDHGNPSLFVFAQLNEPLGGPTFFFVTGLAFTFGINRNLIKPQVQDVSTFPLIKVASGSLTPPATGATNLIPKGMNTYLPPQLGEDFLGVGVKFTSFKVINSFALFVVKFGKELEFDLLGLSSYIAPNPKDPKPVATVELEIVGSYKPSTGTLLIRGMLTPNSFVLSKECHLQGGFAIAVWTGNNPHSGEFVFTFGGYGSHYTPQPYYPQGIPELGFLWQINSNLSIKGGGYWTLTPHRILAGGFLKAVFSLGWVRALFDVNAFFEIDWSPLHYHGHFNVEFSLEVHVDFLFFSCWLGFTVGEGLAIHGPEFGGEASISLYVCTVDIAFGAAPAPKPLLDWTKFFETYTPAKVLTPGTATKPPVMDSKGMVKINLTSGLVKKEHIEVEQTKEKIYVINPKDLCLTASTFMPNSTYQLERKHYQPKAGLGFGIKPMGVDCPVLTITDEGVITPPADGDYETNLLVKIYETGEPDTSKADQFKIIENQENVPRAIWGASTDTGDDTVIPAIMGVDILPGILPVPGKTAAVPRSILAWADNPALVGFDWNDPGQFTTTNPKKTDSGYDADISSALSTAAATSYSTVMEDLGFPADMVSSNSALKTRLDNMDSILIGTLS